MRTHPSALDTLFHVVVDLPHKEVARIGRSKNNADRVLELEVGFNCIFAQICSFLRGGIRIRISGFAQAQPLGVIPCVAFEQCCLKARRLGSRHLYAVLVPDLDSPVIGGGRLEGSALIGNINRLVRAHLTGVPHNSAAVLEGFVSGHDDFISSLLLSGGGRLHFPAEVRGRVVDSHRIFDVVGHQIGDRHVGCSDCLHRGQRRQHGDDHQNGEQSRKKTVCFFHLLASLSFAKM